MKFGFIFAIGFEEGSKWKLYRQDDNKKKVMAIANDWLIDWCLTPTLVLFQLYRGMNNNQCDSDKIMTVAIICVVNKCYYKIRYWQHFLFFCHKFKKMQGK